MTMPANYTNYRWEERPRISFHWGPSPASITTAKFSVWSRVCTQLTPGPQPPWLREAPQKTPGRLAKSNTF